jgi:hypothetical protein
MKLLSYCLISSLAFLFNWCEKDDLPTCTALPHTIEVDVYINLLEVESTHWCRQEWEVKFWKVYCDERIIAPLTYRYKGCYAFEGEVFIQKQTQGVWEMKFSDSEDQFVIQVYDYEYENKIRGELVLTGMQIYKMTDQGNKSLIVVGAISPDGDCVFAY